MRRRVAARGALMSTQFEDGKESRMLSNLNNEEKQWGMGCHLASLAGFVIPLGNIFGPLVVWLIKKNDSAFVDSQGKESLNFQISMTIYMMIAALSIFLLIGIFLLPLVALLDLILTIVAAVRASNGEEYRYPATIRFFQ
jgi:uncharacterized Tic20 family protein